MTDGFRTAPDPTPTTPGDLDAAHGPLLAERLRAELRSAQAARMAAGPGRMVHARVPLRLMEQAKQRTGIASDDDLLHAALVHLVMDGGPRPSP